MTNVESGVRAVALLSGGLDSHLAVKLVLDQGVEVHAINFVTPFCTCTAQGCRSEARGAAEQLGIPLKVANNSRPLLEAIKSPRFGYGRGLNPCLDCRVISFERAAAYMEEIGASFLVTGEVLGQRPMSQMRRSIEKIEKESGLKGRILRPLSAHHFPPTEVEKEGLIDRDKLLSISGRSRRIQIDVAEELGVNDYPCPAGGCLLTEPDFADRLRSLLREYDSPAMPQVTLLKSGRHIFSTDGQRIIIPRDEMEDRRLKNLKHVLSAVLDTVDIVGPTAGIMTPVAVTEGTLKEAAALLSRYGKGRDREKVTVRAEAVDGSWKTEMTAAPREGARLAESLERV